MRSIICVNVNAMGILAFSNYSTNPVFCLKNTKKYTKIHEEINWNPATWSHGSDDESNSFDRLIQQDFISEWNINWKEKSQHIINSNFCDNLISYSDWHQKKGFTTFGYLEPPQLMVWKSDFLRGSMRFVRVPPYESGVKLTNFTFSWQNGEFLWDQKCSPHFLNQNEELSKKIGACICTYTRVYANTWQGGLIEPPPTLNRVNISVGLKWSLMLKYGGPQTVASFQFSLHCIVSVLH